MSALTADRMTPFREGHFFDFPLAAGKIAYLGALMVLSASGYAEPATTATGKKGLGRSMVHVDNSTGADGAVNVTIERGMFCYANNGSVTRAHIGGSAYAVDDQTVAPDDGTATRSAVGTIRDVDASGVWVEF